MSKITSHRVSQFALHHVLKKIVFPIISAKSPSILLVPEEAETVEVVAEEELIWDKDEEEDDENYVGDQELIAAADQQPPQAPALPSDTVLQPAETELAHSLHGRPPLAFHLGRGKYVIISSFQGRMKLHIREFGTNKVTENKFPTPRGVCLDHVQVRSLMAHMSDIRNRAHAPPTIVTETNWHLGKLVFAAINPEFGANVDFRHYFVPEKRLQATRKGVSLNVRELDHLALVLAQRAEAAWPELQNYLLPCWVDHTSHNDEERAKRQCDYCSPLMDL